MEANRGCSYLAIDSRSSVGEPSVGWSSVRGRGSTAVAVFGVTHVGRLAKGIQGRCLRGEGWCKYQARRRNIEEERNERRASVQFKLAGGSCDCLRTFTSSTGSDKDYLLTWVITPSVTFTSYISLSLGTCLWFFTNIGSIPLFDCRPV